MSGNARRLVSLLALATVLVACTSGGNQPPPENPNLFPAGYKQEILDTLSTTLDDPVKIRDAFISEPVLSPVDRDQRYTVCVRFNGRDLRGQYAGNKERIAYFYAGHLNQLVEAGKEQCSKAAYKPFPELEKLCLAKKCV
jgi:hypothetical protein